MAKWRVLAALTLLLIAAANAEAYEYAGFDKFVKDVGDYLTGGTSNVVNSTGEATQALPPTPPPETPALINGQPYWEYLRLVDNTDQCLVDCYAVVEVSNPTDKPIRLIDNGWSTWVEKADESIDLGEDLNLAVWKKNMKEVDEPVEGDVVIRYNCPTDRYTAAAKDGIINGTCVGEDGSPIWSAAVEGTTENNGITTVTGKGRGVKEYVKKQVEVEEYEPTSMSDIVIAPGEKKLVRIEGKKVAALGENNVDWKLEYMGVRPPWAWWNSSWSYRQNYTISNGGASGLTNFQVIMDVNTSTLISGGKMRSDCADIRFTNAAGTGTVYHTLQKGTCNKVHTYITVNVSSIPASGSSIITMYYGNSNALSTDNPDLVYDFYDGFESYNDNSDINGQNGWGVGSSGVIYVRDDVALGESGKALAVTTAGGENVKKTNAATQRSSGIYTLYVNTPGRTSTGERIWDSGGSTITFSTTMDYDTSPYKFKYWTGGWPLIDPVYTYNVWYRIDTAYDNGNSNEYRWIKVNHTTQASNKDRGSVNNPYYDGVTMGPNSATPVYADEISISKFAETMPTYTAGSEEYLTRPAFQSFNATPSTVTTGNPVNVTANITKGLFALDRWWYTYNGTKGGIAAAQSGMNSLTWDTTGLLGNYVLQGYVNDTDGYVASSTQTSVNVVPTSTTTTTLQGNPLPGGENDALIKAKTGGIQVLPYNHRLYASVSNLTLKRPDGQYACCGIDNGNNWACAQGVC